ncbi:sugar ABC transporter ATP-binding protein [Paludifilum halophilum]|uniref:D-xylose ABC transporter ATP-binding protein n=1 Tax=Paludifilum halophilum TaxID=1642702 RepID=A0A235B476_9BACL|nr:sugar ABC transporter ATP-binding protein [Paludifilum halophilum]OYD07108.1 D-xylose ABC transporter ATP-binding protein [Paludifilum halophilum]
MTEPLLEMKGISKAFAGVRVLKEVSFTLAPGEVHALMGENGAGKSTLIKILGGIYAKDEGRIWVDGRERTIRSPREATQLGIAIIHQELPVVPQLTVMENMFLGREFTYKWRSIRWNRMREESQKYLSQLGVRIDPDQKVGELSVGQQQMVEIAKVLSLQAKVLVLDEPTAALTNREIESLFEVVESLKRHGVGMIYISHRMEEVFRISDRMTVLRDGTFVGTRETGSTDMDQLVQMMVGREIRERFPRRSLRMGGERLQVEGMTRKEKVSDISFTIRGGEILGLAGLMGAGRTEVADLLFGVERLDAGRVSIDGWPVTIRRPIDAIRAGIAYVTENRKEQGLVLSRSVKENLSLPNLGALTSFGILRRGVEKRMTEAQVKQLSVRAADSDQEVGTLSGGNQQKVVIGKWLAARPKVLILDEPTRGVDIGAKAEIYRLMNRLAEEGMAILLISSDLPEVLEMSDRVLVMHEGRISGVFDRDEATQEKVMIAASGGGKLAD